MSRSNNRSNYDLAVDEINAAINKYQEALKLVRKNSVEPIKKVDSLLTEKIQELKDRKQAIAKVRSDIRDIERSLEEQEKERERALLNNEL